MRTAKGGRWPQARRTILLACLLSTLVGCAVSVAFGARATRHDSAAVMLAANRLERLVADLETEQLRYVATGDRSFLAPWHAARAAFLREAAELERIAAESDSQQARRAGEIVRSA